MKKIIITLFTLLLLPLASFAQDINVAFTIDNNYPLYTMIVIDSIIKNNHSNSHYNFYIVENNITQKNKTKMTNFVKKLNQNIEFIHYDSNALVKGKNLYTFSNRITSIAMARILLPELLPNIHKVIYMDSDIFVNADLKDLYNIDLHNKCFGMALNIIQETEYAKITSKWRDIYYNSGVIVMDLDRCRKLNVTKAMTSYLHNNLQLFIFDELDENKVSFLYPDQDLINLIMQDEIYRIPVIWNNQIINRNTLCKYEETKIFHYIGPVKPWSFHMFHYPYRVYYKFWLKSPFKMQIFSSFGKNIYKNYKNMCRKRINVYKMIDKNLI